MNPSDHPTPHVPPTARPCGEVEFHVRTNRRGECYIPPALTIERATDPDRFRLTSEYGSRDNVTWHDAVLSIESQYPSLRREVGGYVHPAIVEMLNDIRHCDATGVAALTLHGEAR